VLMASGYIAGGALAGIVIAFLAGIPTFENFNAKVEAFSKGNPFFSGANADLLSVLPFLVLIVLLYLTGREVILANKKRGSTE
jgi:hypothetical protein